MKSTLKQWMLILLWAMPFGLYAQWSTNPAINNVICNLAGEQVIPKIATCSNGDTYIGYFSNETGNYDVRLQRLDSQGNILWAPNGILISNKPQESWLTDWDMTCDNANHAILAFNDIRTGNTNVVAYRISPSGSFVWGPDGVMLSNNSAFNAAPKVVATAAGNAVFAWSSDDAIIIQKVSPSGSLQWGPNGITLTSANRLTWPQLLPVGTDEVILKYFNDSGVPNAPTRHVFAQKYSSSGTTVWASPASVSTAGGISAWTQIFPFINDGSDGFYIAWHDDRDNNQKASTFVQHVNASGQVQFPANGVEASTLSSMNHYYPVLALPPGSNDVFVYWNEMNPLQSQWGIYGQKISSTGTTQWGNNGKTFIQVSTADVYPIAARNSPTDMVVFFEAYFNSVDGSLKAMRIALDGSYVWTPSQKVLCSVQSQKIHTVVNEYGNGQWIMSWEDTRNADPDVYAQNIQLNGDLGPAASTDGTISGHVAITGGTINVTQVLIQAGSVTTHPVSNGNYSLVVPAGTYSVTASHSYTTSQTINNVTVVASGTTAGVDFALAVNRADMVCKSHDNHGAVMNNVAVTIQGPEGPYTGTIQNDSLVFTHVPYGTYQGEATYQGAGPVHSDTVIGQDNHDLIFFFDFTGVSDIPFLSRLQVIPNPSTTRSILHYSLSKPGSGWLEMTDLTGRKMAEYRLPVMDAGEHQISLSTITGGKQVAPGIWFIRLREEQGGTRVCKVVVE